jgi:hypothetical protein
MSKFIIINNGTEYIDSLVSVHGVFLFPSGRAQDRLQLYPNQHPRQLQRSRLVYFGTQLSFTKSFVQYICGRPPTPVPDYQHQKLYGFHEYSANHQPAQQRLFKGPGTNWRWRYCETNIEIEMSFL